MLTGRKENGIIKTYQTGRKYREYREYRGYRKCTDLLEIYIRRRNNESVIYRITKTKFQERTNVPLYQSVRSYITEEINLYQNLKLEFETR